MLNKSEQQELEFRLDEVVSSISILESTDPEHPALYHLRSERKWMEQRLKKTFWYQISWKLKSARGILLMFTLGIRIWFLSKVRDNAPLRLILLMVFMFSTFSIAVFFVGRQIFGWDFNKDGDSPIDEWALDQFSKFWRWVKKVFDFS